MVNEINEVKMYPQIWGGFGLGTGILSVLLFLAPYFGLPLAIFAIVAYNIQRKIQESGVGTAGLILGIIGVIFNVITGLLALIVLSI